jgi:hypothetical protein
MPTVEIKTETKQTVTMRLTGAEICDLLRGQARAIPATARVYINIPGGGDYSSTRLDVDVDVPVIVTWTEVVEADG